MDDTIDSMLVEFPTDILEVVLQDKASDLRGKVEG